MLPQHRVMRKGLQVRKWHFCDISRRLCHVRFWGVKRSCRKLPIRNVRFHVGSRSLSGRPIDIAKATFMTQAGLSAHDGFATRGIAVEVARLRAVNTLRYRHFRFATESSDRRWPLEMGRASCRERV